MGEGNRTSRFFCAAFFQIRFAYTISIENAITRVNKAEITFVSKSVEKMDATKMPASAPVRMLFIRIIGPGVDTNL